MSIVGSNTRNEAAVSWRRNGSRGKSGRQYVCDGAGGVDAGGVGVVEVEEEEEERVLVGAGRRRSLRAALEQHTVADMINVLLILKGS